MSVWPTLTLSLARPLNDTTSASETSAAAAILASVSPAFTTWTVPSTGGMSSFWPTLRASLDLRWFAHHSVIIDTPKWWAMPVSVSPDRTR